jgi:hypothetical protein
MPESLDDKLARQFAAYDVKFEAMDKKLTRLLDMVEGLVVSMAGVRAAVNQPPKQPKT